MFGSLNFFYYVCPITSKVMLHKLKKTMQQITNQNQITN
jgi:cytochrome oxidase Cu insertion factor (SCO1/SenC/PrrC family)